VEFDFRRELTTEDGEIDEEAASSYAEELSQRFAESPEGAAIAGRGLEPGHYLDLFLDYALRYIGVSPAQMDAGDIRETLNVMAEKVTARPEDFDAVIPELEGFCDFVGRAFAFEKAAVWKRDSVLRTGIPPRHSGPPTVGYGEVDDDGRTVPRLRPEQRGRPRSMVSHEAGRADRRDRSRKGIGAGRDDVRLGQAAPGYRPHRSRGRTWHGGCRHQAARERRSCRR